MYKAILGPVDVQPTSKVHKAEAAILQIGAILQK